MPDLRRLPVLPCVIQSPHLNACPQYSIVLFEHPLLTIRQWARLPASSSSKRPLTRNSLALTVLPLYILFWKGEILGRYHAFLFFFSVVPQVLVFPISKRLT